MKKIPVKKAVIPAAGLGTRFLPATKAIPKEMLPIVDIPTVQYIVEEAVQSGIEEILIITNSNKHCMENHFDKNYELEARLLESGKQAEADLIDRIAGLPTSTMCGRRSRRGWATRSSVPNLLSGTSPSPSSSAMTWSSTRAESRL